MSFHRAGYYAVNFGLDSDNVMRIGGWSAGANRWELDMSGNNWVASSFRAPIFYDSDNTGYYGDFASTSNFNRLNLVGFDSSGRNYSREWIEFPNSSGLYSPINGAHFYPNAQSSYGSWNLQGTRNGWAGIFFSSGGFSAHYMLESGNGGLYFQDSGRWANYYNYSNNCTGFGTSTTNSAFNIYCPTGIYSGGRVDGTIFYDANNSAYYVDPTGGTSLRTVGDWRADSSAWTGEFAGKMQYHSNNWYLQFSGSMLFRNAGGTNVMDCNSSGTVVFSGNVQANSDERLKKDWASMPADFVERLAVVKSGTFTRIDSDERQAGSSAQDWQKLLPEVVMEGSDEKKTLSLAYGNAALVSAVELAKYVTALEKRISELEARL
jgi:hypothetical protein